MNRFFDAQPSSFPQANNYMVLPQRFHRIQAQSFPSSSHRQLPVTPVIATPCSSNNKNNNGEPRPLPNFVAPGRFDVICARGSTAANHVGNLRFRDIIKQRLPDYSAAKNKLEKSMIVSSIVDAVRDYTPNGGFVKQDCNGQWYDVGDALAREKIGQCIRDQLHSKYKSSTKAKKQRRKAMNQKLKKDAPSNTTRRITPIMPVSSSHHQLSSFDPFSNEQEDRLGMAPLVEGSDQEEDYPKEGDALALMLAPIGESFVTGNIEAL